jgi:hypothetical protein
MRPRTLITVIVSSGLLALGGTLMAQAAIPGADGVFTACINKTSGAVRIIDAEKTPRVNCAANEIRRTWSAQGQPGADGVSGYQIVTSEDEFTFQGNTIGVADSAGCPAGKKVVGGGGHASYLPAGAQFFHGAAVVITQPLLDGSAWEVDFGKTDGSVFNPGDRIEWSVYAVCVTALP